MFRPPALRLIHTRIGLMEYLFGGGGGLPPVGNRQTDTDLYPLGATGQGDGPEHADRDPSGALLAGSMGTGVGTGVGEEDGELVAADTGGEVTATYGGVQAGRDRTEECVADGMAMCVIDGLEVVDIAEQHDDGCSVPAVRGHRRLELAGEQNAVGQAGQPVVMRLVLKPLVRTMHIADQPAVLRDDDDLAEADEHGEADCR
ncbi:hypothetical protein Ga0074812_13152 [Parafrankia irregularis]|uniref:Uncharacterized protein n=1 Tax=Parafrankia irregularis TaxID=795642 RepID=A0A0S4QZ77_9ACTN|nr:hypothetical protein Ga0074812_13152 [Parafrankia irregularis]